MNAHLVKVGGLNMTVQALVTLVSGLIIGIVLACVSSAGVAIGIPLFLAFCVAAYNVNCAIVGHCQVWANVLTCVYAIYAIVCLLSLMMGKEPKVPGSAPSSPKSPRSPRK